MRFFSKISKQLLQDGVYNSKYFYTIEACKRIGICNFLYLLAFLKGRYLMTRKNLKTFDKEQCLKGGLSKVKPKGAFNNYVDRTLPFFDPPSALPLRGQKQTFLTPSSPLILSTQLLHGLLGNHEFHWYVSNRRIAFLWDYLLNENVSIFHL